jgi:hypothetical protein
MVALGRLDPRFGQVHAVRHRSSPGEVDGLEIALLSLEAGAAFDRLELASMRVSRRQPPRGVPQHTRRPVLVLDEAQPAAFKQEFICCVVLCPVSRPAWRQGVTPSRPRRPRQLPARAIH